MDCPSCANTVTQTQDPAGGISFHCPACGWGTGTTANTPAPKIQRTATTGQLAFLWAASIVILAAPYLALRFGVPYFADTGIGPIEDAATQFVTLLNMHYWWVFILYVLIAGLITPTYDPENVGWFGGFLDNPFTWEDNYNRAMRRLAFLLLPGRTVWIAVVETGRIALATIKR